MYVCPTSGCPKAGEGVMQCTEGYDPLAPLCAVCSPGYFSQMRSCVRCSRVYIGAAVGGVVMVIAVFLVVASQVWKYRERLSKKHTFAHIKIFVSFITVARTLDTQFAVGRYGDRYIRIYIYMYIGIRIHVIIHK
jgi:hypothetical protein